MHFLPFMFNTHIMFKTYHHSSESCEQQTCSKRYLHSQMVHSGIRYKQLLTPQFLSMLTNPFFFKLSHLQFPKCSKRIAEGRPHTSTCDTLIVSPTQSESNYLNGSILLDAWRHCYGCRLRWVVKILPSHTPAMLIYIPLLARIGYTGDLMMKS